MTRDRREMIRRKAGEFEVMSDGRTVWVNRIALVARFCPVSHEIFNDIGTEGFLYVKRHPDDAPTIQHWLAFVDLVKQRYHVTIEDEHLPLYIKGDDA